MELQAIASCLAKSRGDLPMAERESVTLPLQCQLCGKPLTVVVAGSGPKPIQATWVCPWCHGANTGGLSGRVVSVKPGQVLG